MALVAELSRSAEPPRAKADLLRSWDRVLGLDLDRKPDDRPLPAGAAELLAQRDRARAAKDFARSDALRDTLRALGVEVADQPLKK
jgi:cysteinyl-tRNA synthetase